jgi:hypothetical protein
VATGGVQGKGRRAVLPRRQGRRCCAAWCG